MSDPVPRVASAIRALRRRCPLCGAGGVSRHPAHVLPGCPSCGLDFERNVGAFIGGVGLNTIVALGSLVVVMAVGFVVSAGEDVVVKVLIPSLVTAVVVPVVFYARSRLLWVAVELWMWPIEDS